MLYNTYITVILAQAFSPKSKSLKLIFKFKPNHVDTFLQSFRQLSLQLEEPLFDDRRANQLLMLELSSKCIKHLTHNGSTNSTNTSTILTPVLSEKEIAALQYVAGHVIHKIYLKLRKSKNRNKDHFQQCIQLLRSLKVQPNESQKLVSMKDCGGLWRTVVCMYRCC